MYDTAALSYVKQWKDEEFESLTCASEPPDDSDELKPEDCSVHLVVQVWNFKYRRVPFSEHPKYCVMDVVGSYWFDEHRAITDFFNKAISFGNKAAEEHFGTYRKELEYYRETGTFPELGKNVESNDGGADKSRKGAQ